MEEATKYFYELTPERMLDAVEEIGVRCTGRSLALNSLENRVYEIEIEVEDEEQLESRYDKFRVAKFYRPGRWTEAQIIEEHEFIFDLVKQEIPAVAPLKFPDGSTLRRLPEMDIFYAVFLKKAGRTLDELKKDQLERLGRLIARLHNVGAKKEFKHRRVLDQVSFGLDSLEFLEKEELILPDYRERYSELVRTICEIAAERLKPFGTQRTHGDLHWGNILWIEQEPFFVDFDDSIRAPVVQDLWLVVPGRDAEALQQRQLLLAGYEQMREFDYRQLDLIEVLRSLRMIHFTAWIGRRQADPAFRNVFSSFGTLEYWNEQISTLAEQVSLIQQGEIF